MKHLETYWKSYWTTHKTMLQQMSSLFSDDFIQLLSRYRLSSIQFQATDPSDECQSIIFDYFLHFFVTPVTPEEPEESVKIHVCQIGIPVVIPSVDFYSPFKTESFLFENYLNLPYEETLMLNRFFLDFVEYHRKIL